MTRHRSDTLTWQEDYEGIEKKENCWKRCFIFKLDIECGLQYVEVVREFGRLKYLDAVSGKVTPPLKRKPLVVRKHLAMGNI